MNKNKPVTISHKKSRGAARSAQKRNQDDAIRALSAYKNANQMPTIEHVKISNDHSLRVTFLGGLQDVGEKNMAVIEYHDQALILDCGMNLGVELPGVNYTINDMTYLEQIKHKIKGYVITHGHLDHIGGLKHTVPLYPAPIYGSRYTLGLVEKVFNDLQEETGQDFTPVLVTASLENHHKHAAGIFTVEFIRVTHSLPDAAAVCIETPIGKIIATGDFRLDPEPLDKMPTDISRLKELGEEGVLLLLSDSSYSNKEGRVPTESTLQQSFHDIINKADGRIFVAAFSSNMNRIQMMINAAVSAGRNIALDGRSMLSYVEIAVRQGILTVPKGTIVPMQQANTITPNKLLVMCTGGQGEPNAALQRMSEGAHKYVNLSPGDTVVISSSPIPGNEVSYDQISNRLSEKGVYLFRHVSHDVDGCGPLHVSGHAMRDEMRDMLRYVQPKFFVPVHAGTLHRKYHAELAIEEGVPRKHTMLPKNGDSLKLTKASIEVTGAVAHGSLLIDQNGRIISGVVVQDRLLLGQDGIVTIMLTVNKKTGQLETSPDIISRGFVEMQTSGALIDELRSELRRAVSQRFKRVELDRFRSEIKDFTAQWIYEKTGNAPIVIPVVNVVGNYQKNIQPEPKNHLTDEVRFKEMRARLLYQDQRD